jgi:hypothetical protein
MRRWAGAAAVLLCAAGCGAEDPAVVERSLAPLPVVREPARPVPGIAAEAVQLRTDAAAGGRIQVRITASDTFTVTSVALDSPGFEPVAPREISSAFVPGRVTDLRTPIGKVDCEVAPEPASARLTVVRDGGQAEAVDVPLEAAVLARIHADECREEALTRQVTVELRDLRADGESLLGSLTLVRRSGREEVRVTRLARSVLIAVETGLPLTMDPYEPEASAAVRFTPATCEPHVLAETKQPFRFPVVVQVGAAGEVTVDLPVDEDQRASLQELVRRVCG